MTRVLAECITEEKSKFKAVLKDYLYPALPVVLLAKRLFLAKAYESASELKKEKMRLSAAKWVSFFIYSSF